VGRFNLACEGCKFARQWADFDDQIGGTLDTLTEGERGALTAYLGMEALASSTAQPVAGLDAIGDHTIALSATVVAISAGLEAVCERVSTVQCDPEQRPCARFIRMVQLVGPVADDIAQEIARFRELPPPPQPV